MFKKLILSLVALLASPLVMGQGGDSGVQEFWAETRIFSRQCQDMKCPVPYAKKLLYEAGQPTDELDPELKIILNRIAYTQAQIWADTILEGDYVAEGNTRLDRVVQLIKKDKTLGYLITYSEKAWDVSECNYDWENDSTLTGCLAGRIIESSYVSADFKNYFYDAKTAAAFEK